MMNQLIKETSPYLLQHAHNPVDWYPWGKEALDKAQRENKLIIVSIGYSACHWCHVMEKESFEDNEVAEVMNAMFINIKIDREERPDIDQIYMSALQLMNGQGGWPLNCILLPDQRPVYGGTYFRKSDWINVLSNVALLYRNEPDKLLDYADKLTAGVRQLESISGTSEKKEIESDLLDEMIKNWSRYFDYDEGGNQGAPKFPIPGSIKFLIRFEHYFPAESLRYYILKTLDKIAKGGIYDQVGGGIYRYSVDGMWRIPHFEKMLYDQGQIISLYAEAYTKFKDPLYKKIFSETISFCESELKNIKEGGYYSALDADSEGEEGKFYCWKSEELDELLKEDATLFKEYFNVEEKGNWEEEKNNLFAVYADHKFLEKHSLDQKSWEEKLNQLKRILLKERNKRVRPGLDDKQLCSWNALLLQGFCDAYKSLNDKNHLQLCISLEEFIDQKLLINGQLFRSYKNGETKIPAFFDDYANYIQALISLYEITFDEKYLQKANALIEKIMREFYDQESGLFYYTSNLSEELIARKLEFYDSVIPSSNSTILESFHKMSHITSEDFYSEIADKMIPPIIKFMKKHPSSFFNWGNYVLFNLKGLNEVIITGNKTEELRAELEQTYHPSKIIAGDRNGNSTLEIFNSRYIEEESLIYVCKNKTCHLPAKDVASAVSQF